MAMEHSVDITRGLPELPSGTDGDASSPPVPGGLQPPTPVDAAEPGSWSLLLVPVAICVGLLLFSAVFGQV